MQHPNPYVEKLLGLEPLKTWSLIVTIFGDLDGDTLTGGQLRTLLAPLGVKPEATRVALHRLKTDGWITSRKTGREASYRLSPYGQRETKAVWPDVYGKTDKHSESWNLLLLQDATDHPDAISVSRETIVLPASADDVPSDALVLPIKDTVVPDWIETRLVPPNFLRNMEVLAGVLTDARDRIRNMSASDVATLRIITLHHWRRLALRNGTWAHIGIYRNGVAARCRRVVTEFLNDSERTSV